MSNSVNIDLKVNTKLGRLRARFDNPGEEEVVLRYPYVPTEVIIEHESGQRAEFYLSLPYGAKVNSFKLGAGQETFIEFDLSSDFVYPCGGNYKAWIEYNSCVPTASYDSGEELTRLKCRSNEVSFPIELPS